MPRGSGALHTLFCLWFDTRERVRVCHLLPVQFCLWFDTRESASFHLLPVPQMSMGAFLRFSKIIIPLMSSLLAHFALCSC